MTRRDAGAVVIIVAVVTILFSDVLFFGRAFYFRDVTRFYYPMKKVTRDIILSGDLPSWNLALSEGQPLAANPEFAVFYPPNWLLLLPDYELAFRLHILLHYYLAAIGVYVLLRSRALRAESAMFGAFAYSFGGLLLSLSCLIPYLFCLAWLPWIAFFASRPSRRDAALAAICLSMIFVGGEPVTIAQCVLMVGAYAFPVWRRAPSLAAITIIGALLIASVQIVPAADHLRDSVRSRPFPFSLVSTWSTPPVKALELIIPRALGSGGEHARFYWGTAKYRWLDPFFISIYPGLLTTALALSALLLRRRGTALIAAAIVGGFVLAIGSHTPLLRMLYEMRLFSSFRFPEKFLILAVVPLTLFAAFAFDQLLKGDDALARLAIAFACVIGAACAVLAVLALSPSYVNAFVRFWSIEVHPLREAMAALSLRAWLFGLIRALSVVGLLAARKRMRVEAFARLAVALLVVDLAVERPLVAETIDKSFFARRPSTVSAIPRGVRLFHQADWYGATAVARAYFDMPEMYWVLRNGAYPHTGAAFGIESALNRDIDQTALLPTAELLDALRELRRRTPLWVERMAAISSAGYRAVFVPVPLAGRGETIAPTVFLPMPSNPRFYFADRVVHCGSRAQLVASLADASWTPRTACGDGPSFIPGPGEVLAARQRSHSAHLRVRAASAALLVCSITRHKYWSASIDGRGVPLVGANLAYQALLIPAGLHDVELRYDNPLVRTFGVVSLVALITIVILVIIPERDRTQLRPGRSVG
ncbi:MAG: hypothetical protein NVSMB68_09320 [Thermoanaerobaculia bacterium]